mmetsp:Transcript_35841/g.61121  ORF Transcript_35841/g.61121 Transcript_35841/m.61121 type:complete len:172 (-) Transcript_35841:125-640(-)|eukprot:CAMPEP_0183726476 /NCGR_PEP_ID=MMETSP0737-20130205/23338_1 /TAXON_ID=385413 /ORGANISM="Thalassiosira miniscula, Strain CCMP1093" /LENGTH=171 /DNA_ID=CAMNT_0025957833 /DNA_START=141 /DNA_END=656 /DNA_ORIENTATION=+
MASPNSVVYEKLELELAMFMTPCTDAKEEVLEPISEEDENSHSKVETNQHVDIEDQTLSSSMAVISERDEVIQSKIDEQTRALTMMGGNERSNRKMTSPRQIFFLAILSAIIVYSYNVIFYGVGIQTDTLHDLSSSDIQRRSLVEGLIPSDESPSIGQFESFMENAEYYTP